jgi:hypothetical protein
VTYSNGQTTDDQRYQIPDGVDHKLASYCSFAASASELRGTANYKKDILEKVSIKVGTVPSIVEGSFSESLNYQSVEKSTIQDKLTITQASAQCEVYTLSIDPFFKDYTIDSTFISAVNQSYNSDDWNDFIEKYGTHFVKEVTIGSRVLNRLAYSSESVSNLGTLKIDIAAAAKYRLAKFLGDSSVDWRSH